MALSYEEYRKKYTDELDEEVKQAAEESQTRQEAADNPAFEVPDKFKDKSFEEVVRSYGELEQAYSRQGNDLGDMRQTLDRYLELQSFENSTQHADSQQAERTEVTLDTLYDDPDKAVREVVREETSERIQRLEAELARRDAQSALDKIDSDFPGWRADVQSPEFRNWMGERTYRVNLANAGDRGDIGAARELVEMWNDHKAVTQAQSQTQQTQALRDASLETSGGTPETSDVKFSRRELMDIRIKAKLGDEAAEQYMKDNGDAIAIAYAEGRITD